MQLTPPRLSSRLRSSCIAHSSKTCSARLSETTQYNANVVERSAILPHPLSPRDKLLLSRLLNRESNHESSEKTLRTKVYLAL